MTPRPIFLLVAALSFSQIILFLRQIIPLVRIVSLSIVIVFFLFSCQKEIDYAGDGNSEKIDTSALGKFIAATGITDATLKANLGSLISRARIHGWWDLCKAIYPLAGGTASSSCVNLKDTGIYKITWSGSPVFANGGATFDGGASYGDTHLNDSILAYNNAHISFFSNTNDSTIDQWVMGVDDALSPNNELSITNAGFKQAVAYFFTVNGTFSIEQTSTIGWYLVSSGNTAVRIYKDGADITSTTDSQVDRHANNTFLIGTTRSLTGTNTQCTFATIGFNIDSATAAVMYSDILDFVTRK